MASVEILMGHPNGADGDVEENDRFASSPSVRNGMGFGSRNVRKFRLFSDLF
jgi:hypothetical protein